jgi:hypothetical protein
MSRIGLLELLLDLMFCCKCRVPLYTFKVASPSLKFTRLLASATRCIVAVTPQTVRSFVGPAGNSFVLERAAGQENLVVIHHRRLKFCRGEAWRSVLTTAKPPGANTYEELL